MSATPVQNILHITQGPLTITLSRGEARELRDKLSATLDTYITDTDGTPIYSGGSDSAADDFTHEHDMPTIKHVVDETHTVREDHGGKIVTKQVNPKIASLMAAIVFPEPPLTAGQLINRLMDVIRQHDMDIPVYYTGEDDEKMALTDIFVEEINGQPAIAI